MVRMKQFLNQYKSMKLLLEYITELNQIICPIPFHADDATLYFSRVFKDDQPFSKQRERLTPDLSMISDCAEKT